MLLFHTVRNFPKWSFSGGCWHLKAKRQNWHAKMSCEASEPWVNIMLYLTLSRSLHGSCCCTKYGKCCPAYPGGWPLWCIHSKIFGEGAMCLHSTEHNGILTWLDDDKSKNTLAVGFQLFFVYISMCESLESFINIWRILNFGVCVCIFNCFSSKFWGWNGGRCAYFSS